MAWHPTYTGLLVGLLCALMLPDLVSQSLAHDGLVYSNIAFLLTVGEGSFWALPYFDIAVPPFTDHPPLGIYLQHLWMTLAGTGWWSDKLLAGITSLALLGAVLLAARSTSTMQHGGWALLILAAMPLFSDVTINNYLESPLAIVNVLAVTAVWLAWHRSAWAVAAGLLVFTGVLIKGPVGLAPLAAPLGLWFCHRQFLRAFYVGVIALTTVVMAVVLLLVWQEDAYAMLQTYWQQQVVASISGARPAEHGRLYLLTAMGSNLAMASILGAVLLTGWRTSRMATYWLIMGLACSLPLLLSARQYDHYLLPALPFFALAISHFAERARWAGQLPRRGRVIASIAIIALLVITGWQTTQRLGEPGRHYRDIAAASLVDQLVPADGHVGYCPATAPLKVLAYLYRHHQRKVFAYETGQPPAWVMCGRPPFAGAASVAALKDNLRLWRYDRQKIQ